MDSNSNANQNNDKLSSTEDILSSLCTIQHQMTSFGKSLKIINGQKNQEERLLISNSRQLISRWRAPSKQGLFGSLWDIVILFIRTYLKAVPKLNYRVFHFIVHYPLIWKNLKMQRPPQKFGEKKLRIQSFFKYHSD